MVDAPIYKKSMSFSIRIVRLFQHLTEQKAEYVMSKQLLRSGTSIGANLREATFAQTKKDFIHKCSLALKEASETQYWLELLSQTEYITGKEYDSISSDCNELVSLLVSTVKTAKANSP